MGLQPLRMLFFFQAEDGIRDWSVTGVQTCALPIYRKAPVTRLGRDRHGRARRPILAFATTSTMTLDDSVSCVASPRPAPRRCVHDESAVGAAAVIVDHVTAPPRVVAGRTFVVVAVV